MKILFAFPEELSLISKRFFRFPGSTCTFFESRIMITFGVWYPSTTIYHVYRRQMVTHRLVRPSSKALWYYARGRDHHLLFRCANRWPDGFDGFNNIHAFDDFAKHNVPPIEPRCDNGCDEELGYVNIPRSVFRVHFYQWPQNTPENHSCLDQHWP